MKKYISLWLVSVLVFFTTASASLEDTSIIDALEKEKNPVTNANFKLNNFDSCRDMTDVMWEYIKTYWESTRSTYWWFDSLKSESINNAITPEFSRDDSAIIEEAADMGETWWWVDFSETNVQVAWVDESDIIKTDWKFIYYYNNWDNYVYIVSIKDKKIAKKIKVPDSFSSPVLYLANGKLTILSSWYINYNYDYNNYWINRNQKTYVIVYDVENIESVRLEKLYVVDWSMQESRRIGDYIYVVSNVGFNIPFYYYKTFDEANFSADKIIPQKIEVNIEWTKWLINSWNAADCNNISYVLPDAETIKEFGFSPSFNIISAINTKDLKEKVSTNVIAWNNSEIYMSLDNLYLTSYMYQNNLTRCPIWARCIVPSINRWANTLIHKMNVDWAKLKYQDSTIVPWTPLTQYSMDEYEENFRILTQTNNWTWKTSESYVDLYILDKNLDLKWSLTRLWEWEQFKSSRYIWKKLFLVTFEQIDPLFVIDVSNPKKPSVLWELKIPWYSTYLHPYDDNHLIGIWYDTRENNYGWIVNSWVKIDLYQINYNKKCWDSNLTEEEQVKCDSWDYKWIIAKQLYTKTLWDYGSYSEALNNPRMFMWNKAQNKLFLPITTYETAEDDMYTKTDFFQWLATITIDKDSWIKENYKLSHFDYKKIEEKRIEECSKYTKETTTPQCVKLINWEEYCQSSKYSYVPKYCYETAWIWEYLASRSWEYSNQFINRALWIGNDVYAISNETLSSHNMNDWKEIFRVEMYKSEK